MGFMDKVKSQASSLAAKTVEAGKAGQAKLDSVQAKRHADSLLQNLGGLVYAQRVGRSGPDDTAKIEQTISDLQAHEQEHGQIGLTADAEEAAPIPTSGTPPSSSYIPSADAAPVGGSFIPTAEPASGGTSIPTASEAPMGASSIPTASADPPATVSDIPMSASSIPTASSEPPVGAPTVPTASEPPAGGSFIPTASEPAAE